MPAAWCVRNDRGYYVRCTDALHMFVVSGRTRVAKRRRGMSWEPAAPSHCSGYSLRELMQAVATHGNCSRKSDAATLVTRMSTGRTRFTVELCRLRLSWWITSWSKTPLATNTIARTAGARMFCTTGLGSRAVCTGRVAHCPGWWKQTRPGRPAVRSRRVLRREQRPSKPCNRGLILRQEIARTTRSGVSPIRDDLRRRVARDAPSHYAPPVGFRVFKAESMSHSGIAILPHVLLRNTATTYTK